MWSWIKKAAKKVWRVIKALVRASVRVAILLATSPMKVWDSVFGFTAWPPKRMRVHIVVLRGPSGPLIERSELSAKLDRPVEILKEAYEAHCNVTVRPYGEGDANKIETWVTILEDEAPAAALQRPTCGFRESIQGDETGDAGDYYRQHVAGWVEGIPISLSFPVTVFVVESIVDHFGCTIPFLSDYVLVTVNGLTAEPSTIAHEIGHRCNIPLERSDPTYLMFSGRAKNEPPYRFAGWEKNVVRSSRHVTYLF